MIPHMLARMASRDKELEVFLRRALKEAGLTQTRAGKLLGRSQTWFPNQLFANPTNTVRALYANAPDMFEKLIVVLKIGREDLMRLAGLTTPPVGNAHQIGLDRLIPVFPAGAGPALDDMDAVEFVSVPTSNGGSYKVIGLRIHGDSMSPYLESGDTAIVAVEPSLIRAGKAIGLYMPDVGSVVKVYVRTLDDGKLLLQSLNARNGDEFFVAPPDARVYGPVINRILRG